MLAAAANNLAVVRYQQGQTDAALASLQIDLGKPADGAAMIHPALAAHPENAELHNIYGLLLAAQQKYPEAQAEYERALAVRPGYVDARVNLAVALSRQEKFADAVADFQAALGADPRNLKAQANLGVTFLPAKRYDEACAALRAAIALDDSDPDLYGNLGLALDKLGKSAEAQQAYAQGKKLSAGAAGHPAATKP